MDIQVQNALSVARGRARTSRERAGIDIALGNCGELNAVCVQLQLRWPGEPVTPGRARLACAIAVLGLSARAAELLTREPRRPQGLRIIGKGIGPLRRDDAERQRLVYSSIEGLRMHSIPVDAFVDELERMPGAGMPIRTTTRITDLAAGTVPEAIE